MPNEQLLPKTIEMRALTHMEKGVEAIEAVKLAFQEEENTIWLLQGVDMGSGRMRKDIANEVVSTLCKRVYNKINSSKL